MKINWRQVFCKHEWYSEGYEFIPTRSKRFERMFLRKVCVECNKVKLLNNHAIVPAKKKDKDA